jgi:NADPH:quinone reductase-like Zn-dependent oxidoreductase
MRALVYRTERAPDDLQVEEVEIPAPKDGEVLVRVQAASINDWDWQILRPPSSLSRLLNRLTKLHILGCDIAGRVEALGAGVTELQLGDEVFGDLCQSGFGALAEYVCAPATSLARKPASMSFEQAAAIPQAGMLAVQALIDIGNVQSRQKILLNGAGGGVGTFALQMAKLHGVEVTVVDSAGKLEMLRALGADHVIDYRAEDFTKGAQRYDLIVDTKTDRSPWAYARVLNPGGVYVTVGGDLLRLLQTFLLRPLVSLVSRRRLEIVALKPNKDLRFMSELFEAGKLRPIIDGPYELDDIAAAFRRFGAGEHRGKIIVVMPRTTAAA